MENLKTFSESLKFLTDISKLISKLGKCEKQYWSICLECYTNLMVKTYGLEKNPENIDESKYLFAFKQSFNNFIMDNLSIFETQLTIDDKFDDKWLTEKSKSETLNQITSRNLNGIVIYQYPNEKKYSKISLPISEIYQCAKELHKKHSEMELPLRVIYGFYLCIYHSFSGDEEIKKSLELSILNLEEYDVNNEIKIENEEKDGIGNLITQFANELDIEVPKNISTSGLFGNLDPSFKSKIKTLAKELTTNLKNESSDGKVTNTSDLFSKVTGMFQSGNMADIFNSLSSGNDLMGTIPKK